MLRDKAVNPANITALFPRCENGLMKFRIASDFIGMIYTPTITARIPITPKGDNVSL
jgi:hypothetical protein